jgi:hypothetical protein
LRLLITEAAPLVVVSVGMFSARTAAYVVGFGLGNIASAWLPIIAVLVSVTGLFGAGANTPECEAYRAQMRAIDTANRVLIATYNQQYQIWINTVFKPYAAAYESWRKSFLIPCETACNIAALSCTIRGCDGGTGCRFACNQHSSQPPYPQSIPQPQLQTYPACASPDCPPGKKVWVQVLWASPSGNFSDSKGCFLVAYSQDAPTLPPNIEYNPFLPKEFVESRAISYYLVDGDRFRGLRDNDWKNLESVSGWDKGYWKAEHTDTECRGWRPGWSRKIK